MTVLRRRPNIFITIAVLLVLSVTFYGYSYQPFAQQPHRTVKPTSQSGFEASWNYTRDAKNLMLSDAQCDAAFPDLFREVDRAVTWRKDNHVTIKEMDKVPFVRGYARAMIYDGDLYMIAAADGVNSRNMATLHAIHRALLTSPESLPNIEFTLNSDDIAPQHATWSYARLAEHTNSWLMPDFGYFSWPEPKIGSYSEVQKKAADMDKKTTWKHKISKLVWRGAVMGLKTREDLLRVSEGKKWADIKVLDWAKDSKGESHDLITMDQHCRYKYVAHTEGVSYSARLQNLQNCRSVIVAHHLKWIQHHTHLMKSSGPDQNFIEVKEDFSNLDEMMTGLMQKDKDAEMEKIADNTVKTFREHYLTPAAETCYWRKLVRGWASVSPEPEFYQKKDGKQVWRGVPVESYFLTGRVEWDLH